MRIAALHRKLLRDLVRLAGPAFAVALVTASGILAFVTMRGAATSIRLARDDFYERALFADAFARLERAPARVAATLAALPGVLQVEARVAEEVVLDVPGFGEPARGRLLSLPGGDGSGGLNRLTLRQGALPARHRDDEVVINEAFALAHRLGPGDTVAVLVNGRRRTLGVVGVAASPEFVYTLAPGSLWPDDRRFGVLWMAHGPLAAWLGSTGAFNDVVLTLAAGARAEEVLGAVEQVLAPWGGQRVLPRRDQISHRFVDEELRQLESQTFLVPLIFLGVAAFILHMVLVRLVDSQRELLGLFKAVGYRDAQLVLHYTAFALVVVAVGAALGLALGVALGDRLIEVYRGFFRFDVLTWQFPPAAVAMALVLSCAAALAGAASATRRILRLPPAVAMQPPAPPTFTRGSLERTRAFAQLGPATRMVLRQLLRRPVRALLTVAGIALAVAIVVVSSVMQDAVTHLIDLTFLQTQREDVEVSIAAPRSRAQLERALGRLPGVRLVEPTRTVPVRIVHGHRSHEGALEGRVSSPRALRLPLDEDARLLPPLRGDGIVVTAALAERLHVATGATVELQRLDGDRRTVRVRVVGLSRDLLGLHIAAPLTVVDGLFPERGTATGALLLVNPDQERALAARLKELPLVAGASFRMAALDNFRRLIAENMAVTRLLLAFFSSVIAVGIVYNSARIALAERQRELATLRVLGFTRREVARVFLGEQLALVVAGIPAGWLVGYGLTMLIVSQAASSDIFRFPVIYRPATVLFGSAVVLAAAGVTALAAKRRLDALDLVGVLKARE